MRRISCAFLTLLLCHLSIAQIYVEPEKDVECSTFLVKEGMGRAQQGLEMWGNYIFSLEDRGHVNVYDFKSASSKPIAGFELASSREDNHANNASFGIETAKGASFPLLYITNGKVGSEIEWTCFVESISRKGKKFTSVLAQEIVLDTARWEGCGYATIYGAPSWMVDRERGCLWVFSARKRTVAKVTRNAWENQYIATKFRVPALSEGKKITLGVNDILDQVIFPFEVWFTQAGCAHDGKIYFCFGVGRQDDSRPSRIRVYDTDTRTITARYDVQNEIPYEPEDIVLRDGWMYVNTNVNKKKTKDLPCIFKLSLPKEKPAPTSALEELKQTPEKAGGVYYITDLACKPTAAPEGYEPFYINGYFRHGARHADNANTCPTIYSVLEKAFAEGNLAPMGEAFYARLKPFKQNVMYKTGDLTQKGYRHTRAIGERMADNYPQVFAGKPYLKSEATNVLRVAATMQSVNSGIQSRFPNLEWDCIDNSQSFLPYLNPYGSVCPGRLEVDGRNIGKKSLWYPGYKEWVLSKVDTSAFMTRIFKDPSTVGVDAFDLEYYFFLFASNMQCLDRQIPMWDLFTEDEIVAWCEAENYKYFCEKGPQPITKGRSWALGSRTLRHILEESFADMASGKHGISLNFGHDGTLMALMTNLASGTWAQEACDPETAWKKWQHWNIPMGTNLQFVFYRSVRSAEILVKVMLNEIELELPLTPVQGLYYKWSELYKLYIEKCNQAEDILSATTELQ